VCRTHFLGGLSFPSYPFWFEVVHGARTLPETEKWAPSSYGNPARESNPGAHAHEVSVITIGAWGGYLNGFSVGYVPHAQIGLATQGRIAQLCKVVRFAVCVAAKWLRGHLGRVSQGHSIGVWGVCGVRGWPSAIGSHFCGFSALASFTLTGDEYAVVPFTISPPHLLWHHGKWYHSSCCGEMVNGTTAVVVVRW
jgi:hypothetical protein